MIVMILMGLLGYRQKTSFQAGFTVAQISEFSIILVTLGITLGHLNSEILSLITIVGIITIAGSAYLILYSDNLYSYLHRPLSLFEKKNTRREGRNNSKCDFLIFGYNVLGREFIASLEKIKKRPLVIDYNPEKVRDLSRKDASVKYGDANDDQFLESLNLRSRKMVISTIPDFLTNLDLVSVIKGAKEKTLVIVVSYDLEEAIRLYKAGADYVATPHFLGGKYVPDMIKRKGFGKNALLKEKRKHIRELEKKRIRPAKE